MAQDMLPDSDGSINVTEFDSDGSCDVACPNDGLILMAQDIIPDSDGSKKLFPGSDSDGSCKVSRSHRRADKSILKLMAREVFPDAGDL